MWPDKFGLACCAMEMIAIVSSRYDIARFGMEAFRSSPRQADLLIVSGRVAHKMAAPLRQIYDQMLEPKWVIAMGACASSGGMFNNYTILQGVDKIVAVDIHVPGCPPRPEALMEGIIRLHEKVLAGVPPAYEIRGVARRDASRASRASSRRRRRTARRRSSSTRRASSRRARYLRDELELPLPLRHRRRPTTSAGASRRVAGYIGTACGPRPERARRRRASHALPAPKPKRFAMNYHLLRRRAGRAARARAGLARRRRAGPSVVPIWPTADWHEREAFDMMGIRDRGPPEPPADPDGGRLGGPPAAQGLPDRRRAGALLGGGVGGDRAETGSGPAIYEGTRIPQPVPTMLQCRGARATSRTS